MTKQITYVMVVPGDRIKIGKSVRPYARLLEHESTYRLEGKMYLLMQITLTELEALTVAKNMSHRIFGEWFVWDIELLAHLAKYHTVWGDLQMPKQDAIEKLTAHLDKLVNCPVKAPHTIPGAQIYGPNRRVIVEQLEEWYAKALADQPLIGCDGRWLARRHHTLHQAGRWWIAKGHGSLAGKFLIMQDEDTPVIRAGRIEAHPAIGLAKARIEYLAMREAHRPPSHPLQTN